MTKIIPNSEPILEECFYTGYKFCLKSEINNLLISTQFEGTCHSKLEFETRVFKTDPFGAMDQLFETIKYSREEDAIANHNNIVQMFTGLKLEPLKPLYKTKPANYLKESEKMTKTLNNSTVSSVHKNVEDLITVGDVHSLKLICKASSEVEGWMKSTKALEIPEVGCLVQVTTQQRNLDASYSIAEALTFVPGVKCIKDENNGHGHKLVKI